MIQIKGLITFLLIFVTYLIIGTSIESSFLYKGNGLIFIYILLLIIIGCNSFLINKLPIKSIALWVICSILPELCLMKYLYTASSNSSGGLISFPWDWLLWELFIPIILGLTQVITIIILTKHRN
jgi:hypothetical protein